MTSREDITLVCGGNHDICSLDTYAGALAGGV